MNANVSTLLDTMRNASTRTTGQGLASIAEVVHQAYSNATNASDEKRNEFNRLLIVLAALIGAFFVLRGVRKLMRLGFVLFWIWFFAGGHFNHVHFWW